MAPYVEVLVSGFEDFNRAVEQHKGKTIFAYFTGSKDAEGKSWCPDCIEGKAGIPGCCPKEVAGSPGRDSGWRAEFMAEEGVLLLEIRRAFYAGILPLCPTLFPFLPLSAPLPQECLLPFDPL